MEKVFLIGGMSESGKSTFGRYLESKGMPRLKIVTFLNKVMIREGATGDFVAWNNKNVLERPGWVREEFTRQFLADTAAQGIEYCALESLYGPDLGVYMKQVVGGDKVIIVYVDMPVEVRLRRQMIRQNITSLEEAENLLLPRDEIKRAWRVPQIEAVADIIIDNSVSLDDLYRRADEIIAHYCPEFNLY